MSRHVLFLGFLFAGLVSAVAAPPAWWASRGATDAHPPNDDTAVNQGQLKQFTQKAVQELNAHIPGGAGPELNSLVNGWVQAYQTGGYSASNPLPADFEVMNSGQLKWIANKIHARLVFAKYEETPPAWLVQNAVTDKQLVNIGQLKTIFNFGLSAPAGTLAEWWQKFYFAGQTGINPSDDPDGDGYDNIAEFTRKTNPLRFTPPIQEFRRIDNADGTITYSWISFAEEGDWFRIEQSQSNGTRKTIYATIYGSAKLPFVFGRQCYSLTLDPAADFLP